MTPYEILQSMKPVSPFAIVETGCASTISIARWVRDYTYDFETKSGVYASFHSVSMNGDLQVQRHKELEGEGLAKYCTFHTQTPMKQFYRGGWISAAFLFPEDLQDGLDQFELVASEGAELVAILDYHTRAARAVIKAREWGWNFRTADRYSVLTRRP